MTVHIKQALLAVAGVIASSALAPLWAQTVHSVPAGGNLQAAIDAARAGDTIALAPGATYVGNFILPAKAGAGFITIRSSAPDALLPRAGQRMDPSFAARLPKLRSPNGASVLATAPKAHHYRLMFLEFMANGAGAGEIIRLGDSTSRQNTLAVVPYEIVIDRVYIHGDVTLGQKRGIALNSAATSIVNSYISEIKAIGQDSQAICGWNGPGPYLIANNYLEGAGENVMFGGGDPFIPNLVPSDITFVGNHLRKPWSWRGTDWTVKNLFELKNARRVRIDGNLFENNWLHAQTGYAILFKSVSQDGRAPWSVVEHVSFTNNVVRHVSSAINILGRDTRYPAVELNNVSIRNNLFTDVSTRYGGNGRFLLINGGSQITLDHNTAITDGQATVLGDGEAVSGFVFTSNVLVGDRYTIFGSGTSEGKPAIARYFPGSHIVANIIPGVDATKYPIANYYPTLAGVGFVDYDGGDYRLAPSSPFVRAGADGANPGVNYDTLLVVPPAVRPPLQPRPPRGLTAKVSGSTVTLSWTASDPVSSYLLEAGMSPGTADAARMDTGNTATSLVVTDVPAGVYYVRVLGATASGHSTPSPEIRVAVGGASDCQGVPQPPTGLKAAVRHLTATLDWAGPAGGCAPTHYVLVAGSAPGLANLAQAAVGGNGLTASADPGTYYVRVLAVNASGVSAPSNEIAVTLRP